MPLRRAGIGIGSLFTSRIDSDDNNYFEFRVTSTNSSLITGNLTYFKAGAAVQVEPFTGSFSYRNRKLIAVLRHPVVDDALITLVGKAHNRNPNNDHFLIKSKWSLVALFKKIEESGGNTGGTASDPDAEGFNRGTSTAQNNIAVAGGTTNPQNAPAIAPGTVILRNNMGAIVGYDMNGEVFATSDVGPVFTPRGTVFYGTRGAANSGWRVDITDTTFTVTAVDALGFM